MMEAKDTVMDWKQVCAKMMELLKEVIEQGLPDMPDTEKVARILKKELEAQAEITWQKAEKQGIEKGIKEVVEFVEKNSWCNAYYLRFKIDRKDWEAFKERKGVK